MKVEIHDSEWYPVTSYEKPKRSSHWRAFNVPAAVIARYDRAEKAFRKAAKELASYRREDNFA